MPDALAEERQAAPSHEIVAEAEAAYQNRDLETARTLLDQVLHAEPSHVPALLLLAQVELEKGDLPASRDAAQRCLDADRTIADCWLTLGVIAQQNDDGPTAITAYEAYLTHAPDGMYAEQVSRQLARLRRERMQ